MVNRLENRQKEQQFIDFLKFRKLRKTPERFEILRMAIEFDGHFDVDLLYNSMEKKGYHVSRATIYNTLELLSECGIVRKLLFDTHQARFEIAEQTHSHLICTNCGDIIEIDLECIDKNIQAMQFNGFSPSYVSTCIYGVCSKCMEKRENCKK
ncbi:MAG: transcriptional repressor [Muribaculaceae bacterium]|nr:transcriptional repressor [Muribaculaceae bacterium]